MSSNGQHSSRPRSRKSGFAKAKHSNLSWQERKLYVLDIPHPGPLAAEATEAQQNAYKKHLDDSTDVCCLMLATMSPELQKQHERMDAYDMIEHLKRMFEGQDRQERFDVSKALYACKQGNRDPVGPHVLKMIGYMETLENLGFPVLPEHQADLILQSLNNNYTQFFINYIMSEIDKTPTELLALLRTAETNMSKANPAPIMMVNKGNAKGKGKWKGKKKIGSKSANLKPAFKRALKPTGGVAKGAAKGDICHFCKKPGHWKRNCQAYLEDQNLKGMKSVKISDSGMHVIEINLSTSTSWVLDTGCGSHICINVQELRRSRTLAKGEVDLRIDNGGCGETSWGEAEDRGGFLKFRGIKAEDLDQAIFYELYACAPEVLAKINISSGSKVGQLQPDQSVRLPRQISDPLLYEMEDCILEAVLNEKIKNSHVTRISIEESPFISKIGGYMSDLLECAVFMIQEYFNDIMHKYDLKSSIDRIESIFASFRSLTSSPLFRIWTVHNVIDVKIRTSITESFERLLKALAELYEGSICCSDNLHPELDLPDSSKLYAPDSSQSKSVRSKIVDMDLDGDDDGTDVEGSVPASAANLKLNFVSIISKNFTVVPVAAWDVMFNLMLLVLVSLLSNLCEHPYWSSDRKSFDLVVSMTGMVDMQADLKLECLNVVVAISRLLQTLILSLNTSERDSNDSIDENQRLCEGGYNFSSLKPQIGQLSLEHSREAACDAPGS
ncbi:hypothetical protein POM88_016433 [Heracleum sosnowskyi]|uniref:CCHC-type domain-containing protein n=1 Tax=Heracleum sosnowskyi TaxID=360622 RepID=A0AAD8IQK8_9APIA|nr:hypothetical protein POM88_016433 [Heracleum sosnowskyi]